LRKARIIKSIGGLYELIDLDSNDVIVARPSGKLRNVKLTEDSSFLKQTTKKTKLEKTTMQISPKVGDFVSYDETDENHPIQEIFERRNELYRPDVANVDQVLLIFAAKNPTFSFMLLDQFLVLIEQAKITPVLIVTKIDLVTKEELDLLKEKLTYYNKIGYTIHYVNSKQKIGFDVLEDLFVDKVSVLAGQTGAGKSTFLNALMPNLELKTQEISKALGRGKHTTRHSELFLFGGGLIADTPGFSKLELKFYDKSDLKEFFIEFREQNDLCRFKNKCDHIHEPGCYFKTPGVMLDSRYENYQKLYEEIKQQKEKY
jgi:ribosome biogenesis GTPase